MNEFELYFVGFYKHDRVQSLVGGPFVYWEDAFNAKEELSRTERGPFVVCKTTLPFAVEEN